MHDDPLTPPFATKIAVAVRDDLESWQRLNVTAFLVSGITAADPELVGEPYVDADGHQHLSLLGVPILVFEASAETLRNARTRALERQIPSAIYTKQMFATGYDADNRGVVAAVAGADLDLVGIGVHGPKNAVAKILKGAHLHP
ncbi:MAG: DUF2000 family protein [Jatrophihabitans sp.]|uniref:DUF2000 family protein n=1 Tax=Jatrophihabitans sp. TaxID=1932789 RepID=UPI00390FB83B